MSDRDIETRAWRLLLDARMRLAGEPIGLRASCDRHAPLLNYDRCFVRDFAVCAPALLLRGETRIVARFLETALRLQSRDRGLEAFQPRPGLMPASFRPRDDGGTSTALDTDYGEESIARVTPVDSVFWWLITLRAYTVVTGDRSLADRDEFQHGIRLALRLVLEGSFEMFPTLLVPEGAFMIDRRMGVYGHPLEVQALFFAALRAADELLAPEADPAVGTATEHRIRNLKHHIDRFYWLDRPRVAHLRTQQRDEFGEEIANAFNIFPDAIPAWVEEWLPDDAGYLLGNLGPGRIDFRFFAQGNLLASTVGLCDPERVGRIFDLYETRWDDLVGAAPLRIVYPAYEGEAWRLITGADAKNRAWCNHNGGWWPCLLWAFAPAAVSFDRADLLERAVHVAERRLEADGWPEYYDGRSDPAVGARARARQSWTLGAYLYAKECLRSPSAADLYRFPDEVVAEAAGPDG